MFVLVIVKGKKIGKNEFRVGWEMGEFVIFLFLRMWNRIRSVFFVVAGVICGCVE